MDEFEIIREYFSGATSPDLVVGVGDDAAVFECSPKHQLVSAVDTLVEGVHFLPSMDSADVGFHLAMVNISDMAAMAARPRWALLSLTLHSADRDWLQGFSSGLKDALARDGVVLIGGDTTRGTERTLSLQVIGEVPSGLALLRSGAKDGDGIYVTGHPGDAAAGLQAAMNGDAAGPLYRKFARPGSRVAYAQSLRGNATAAIDISDGLLTDMSKLLQASGMGAELHIDRLPLSPDLLRYASRQDAIAFCLSGGDDYEILFTAPVEPPVCADTVVTRIGTVTQGSDVQCYDQGEIFVPTDSGYRHFQ